MLSFVFLIYGIVIRFFFPGRPIAGWASVFVAVLFLGGVQLICIGILGEYLGRMYDEVKRRPLYISQEEINLEGGAQQPGVGISSLALPVVRWVTLERAVTWPMLVLAAAFVVSLALKAANVGDRRAASS